MNNHSTSLSIQTHKAMNKFKKQISQESAVSLPRRRSNGKKMTDDHITDGRIILNEHIILG